MKLDKRSSVPLYAQLKELLGERIKNGEYQPGEKIPTELALCEELDLSRPTVRQAIAELVAEGLLYIVKGRGTFVTDTPERVDVPDYHAFSFSFLGSKDLESKRILDYNLITKVTADLRDRFADKADLSRGVYEILWALDDEKEEPYAFCTAWIPAIYFPNLLEDLRARRSMSEITGSRFAAVPTAAEAELFLRPAQGEEARYLDISKAYPVFVHESHLFTRNGQLCEAICAVLRSDRCAFKLEKTSRRIL